MRLPTLPKILIISSFLSLALSISATAKEGFTTIEKAIEVPRQIRASAAASFRYKPTDNSICSAVLTSSNGHALTALHCLRHCLRDIGLMESYTYLNLDTSQVIDQTPPDLYCRVIVEQRSKFVKVLFLGSGTWDGDTRLHWLFGTEDFKNISKITGDFAVMQFESEDIPKHSKCVRARAEPIHAGEKVFAASYPTQTARPDSPNSNGYSAYLSEGQIYSRKETLKQTALSTLQNYDPILSFFGVGESELESRIPSLRKTFASSMDIVGGSSGSAALDKNGLLIGINTSSYSTPEEYKALSFSYRISEIRKQLTPELEAEVFNCGD